MRTKYHMVSQGKKVLITGALGHIGSALIRSFPAGSTDTLILVDNLSTQRYSSLFDLSPNPSVKFIEGDILDLELEEIVRGADVVIHLAALTDAESSFKHPEEMMRVNLEGTRRVATACQKAQVPLVFLSTTSVYGVQDGKVDESCEDSMLRPQSPYAESKHKAELMLAGREFSSLQYVIFRFGTIFGISRGMRFHTAINKFVWQACLGKKITVWKGALDQNRPYLDLQDAVAVIHFAIAHQLFDRSIYNVVTLNATVRMVVDEIRKFFPKLSVELVESPIMNQLSYHVLAEKIENKGFVSRGNLSMGIRDTVRLLKPW